MCSIEIWITFTKITEHWFLFLLTGAEFQLILGAWMRLLLKPSATMAWNFGVPGLAAVQRCVLQLLLPGSVGFFLFHCSFGVYVHHSLWSSVNIFAGRSFWGHQPDQPWIAEFPLILVVPDSPSDTCYALPSSAFPSPLSTLSFNSSCSVPVRLQEESAFGRV